jgi:hypothetical protein
MAAFGACYPYRSVAHDAAIDRRGNATQENSPMPTEGLSAEQEDKVRAVLEADAQYCACRYQGADRSVWDAVRASREPFAAAMHSFVKRDFAAAAIHFDEAAASMKRVAKIAPNPVDAAYDLLDAETKAFRAIAVWARVDTAVGVDDKERYAEEARDLTLEALSERDAHSSVIVGYAKTLAKAWADRPSASNEQKTPLVHDSLLKLGTMSRDDRIKQYLMSMPQPRVVSPPVPARNCCWR